ncbi:hypothetical protein P4S84_25815, partial [Aneurinibacillus aneurinilyticus]|uniref:hypothetical protein n=1 Tax=Aneurinibacillus aneurinilyticus TaxID=1391 RepID=UPI002E2391B9|nr:hypothetical protein [Aneurinibacillus aneurinilyticus]
MEQFRRKSQNIKDILPRVLIIQYDPEWVVTTPCPNGRRFVSRTEASRAAFCPSEAGPQNIWVD